MAIINRLSRLADILCASLISISGASVVLMMLLVSSSSILRYVFNRPTFIMEEGTALLLILSYFTGLAYLFRKRGHIKIVLITDLLPPIVRTYVALLAELVVFSFLVIFIREAIKFTTVSIKLGARSETASIYLPPWQLVICFSTLVFALVVLASIIERIRNIAMGKLEAKEELGSIID